MIRFSVHYVVYSLILAAIAYGTQLLFPEKEVLMPAFWAVFIFLFLLTYLAYGLSYWGIVKGGQNGVYSILGGLVLKLLFAMALALFISIKVSVNQVVFALDYFSLYLLLTGFEVIYLLRNLRDQINK